MSVVRPIAVAGMLVLAACHDSPVEPGTRVVSPRCSTPAPLLGTYNGAAPGYIVAMRVGTDVSAEAARLSAKHGFTPTQVWDGLGFFTYASAEAVAALRCEASITSVERNNVVELR